MKLDPKYSLYICYVNNLKAKPHADIFFLLQRPLILLVHIGKIIVGFTLLFQH